MVQRIIQFLISLWKQIPGRTEPIPIGYPQADIDRLIQLTNYDYSQVKLGGLSHQVDMAKQLYSEYSKTHPENYNKKNFSGFLSMSSSHLAGELCNTVSRYLWLNEVCNQSQLPSFWVFYIFAINKGYIVKDGDGYLAKGADLDGLVNHFYPSSLIEFDRFGANPCSQDEMIKAFMDSKQRMALIRVGWYDKAGKPKLPSTHTLRIARTFDDKIICLDTDHHERSGKLLADICPDVVWIESMYWYEA